LVPVSAITEVASAWEIEVEFFLLPELLVADLYKYLGNY